MRILILPLILALLQSCASLGIGTYPDLPAIVDWISRELGVSPKIEGNNSVTVRWIAEDGTTYGLDLVFLDGDWVIARAWKINPPEVL